jgi:hypothetical protein
MNGPAQTVDRSTAFRMAAEQLEPTTFQPKLKKYWYDPNLFIKDFFIGYKSAKYQIECIGILPKEKRVCVRGPHGLGKTAMVAGIVLWFAHTREDMCKALGGDWKIVTTASVQRQLDKFLWPEIKKWSRQSTFAWEQLGRDPFDRRTELLFTQLKLEYGEGFAASSTDPANIEGAHADHILYIVDEAKTVAPETFDAMEGALSGTGEAYAFVISTPGEPSGRFYEIQSHKPGFEDWWVRYVTLPEAIKANRITLEWANARKRQWGENSAIYQNRVLGNFAVDEEDGIIPLAWAEAAMLRSNNSSGIEIDERTGTPKRADQNRASCISCDVAGMGSDKSTIAIRVGYICLPIIVSRSRDTMELTGEIIRVLHEHGFPYSTYAIVDVIGIGAGVVARLAEQGYDVEPFNASSASIFTDISGELEFLNRRAAAWWGMRELLNPANPVSSQVILPNDEELLGDLCTPHYKSTSAGRIQVEEKDQIRKRLGRSPDRGDAVVMAYADRMELPQSSVVEFYDPVSISPY